MHTLLIVEDKIDSVQAMKHLIDWEQEGISDIVTATNGKEGLIAYKQYQPEVVITDIKMPYMDGLEMLEKIKGMEETTQVIILSGYDEFSFAQRAMKLGAQEYLLKPASIEEIKEAVRRAISEIDSKRLAVKKEIDLKEQLEDIKAVKKKDYLNNLISTRVKQVDEMKRRCEDLGLHIEGPKNRCAVISVDHFRQLEAKMSIDEMEVTRYLTMNIVGEVMKDFTCETFVCSDREFCLLLTDAMQKDTYYLDRLEKALELCRQKIKMMLKFTVTIGVGKAFCCYDEMPDAFASAKEVLKYRMLLGKDRIILYTSLNQIRQQEVLKCSEILEGIKRGLKTGAPDTIHRLELWGDSLKEVSDILEAKVLVYQLLGSIKQMLRHHGLKVASIDADMKEIRRLNDSHAHMEDLVERMKGCCEKVIEEMGHQPKELSNKEVKRALEHIKKHYHEHITLNSLAEEVNLSPAYLSSLLKRYTGKTFTTIVTEERMEKAKKLLLTNNYKVYEVADQVGYTDRRYFSETFKKYTEMNPKVYIDHYGTIK